MCTYYVRDHSGNIISIYTGNETTALQKEMAVYGSGRLGTAAVDAQGEFIESYLYELTDHLGNVRATLKDNYNGNGLLNSYADYYPGGMPMPGAERTSVSSGDYKFGYQGQFAEKDQETGFNQFEARLYDARIMRWNVPDPAGQFWSPYNGMGNDWINGVDPDGREWYTNWLGGQKWFDGADNSNWYWSINSGSGFDYRMDDGSIIHNMNMGDVTITGKIPVWKSNGTINTMHPNYAQNQRKKERMYKYESQQESWEGQQGWDSRGKYVVGSVATICSMGATEFLGVATTVTRIASSVSIAKNVISSGDSPILDPNGLGGQIPGVAIDATNVVLEIHGITTGDFSGVVSLPTDAKSLFDNSVGIFNNLNEN